MTNFLNTFYGPPNRPNRAAVLRALKLPAERKYTLWCGFLNELANYFEIDPREHCMAEMYDLLMAALVEKGIVKK